MARAWSRPVIPDVVPDTDQVVDALWHRATRRGPYPSTEACESQATTLNELIWHAADRTRAREAVRAAEAARLLIKTMSSYLARFDAAKLEPKAWQSANVSAEPSLLSVEDYNILAAARLTIVEALSVIDPFNFSVTPEQEMWFAAQDGGRERLVKLKHRIARRTGQQPWEATAIVCWMLARDALTEINRQVGTSLDAVATKFAALATQRLGFPAVTPRAISERLNQLG